MEQIEKVQEEITTAVESITVDIPVRVKLTSVNNAPFEFETSIDEVGQIVITPMTKDVTFEDANTDSNVDYEVPIAEQETIITNDDGLTIKETTIFIRANMLKEDDNIDVSAAVDEIGQCVIYPLAKNNTFVSAAIEDNLNLVTEDMKVVDYCGYKLINAGDGWDIKDPDGEIVEEGVATESAAKVLICKEEIKRLEGLTEAVEEAEPDAEQPVEVEAEVLDENVVKYPVEVEERTAEEIEAILVEITNNFSEERGAVKCDTLTEKAECVKLLQTKYNTVTAENKSDYYVVMYSKED